MGWLLQGGISTEGSSPVGGYPCHHRAPDRAAGGSVLFAPLVSSYTSAHVQSIEKPRPGLAVVQQFWL